jgi:DNA-binding beta-propeller fold protein YncE
MRGTDAVRIRIAAAALSSCSALVLASGATAVRAAGDEPPQYRVDPSWPKQLPNDWIMGQVGGMAVDSQGHIWVLQRPRSASADELGAEQTPPRSDCCKMTPAILEFTTDGTLLRSWGGPGFVPDWPTLEHALWIDGGGNVWISGAGVDDRQVIKFSPDGRQLLEIGGKSRAPKNNQDVTLLGRPAGLDVDDAAHEVYIADGYLNNRVVVYDSDTGRFKRGWGAYGIPLREIPNTVEQAENELVTAGTIPPYKPGDPPDKQFRSPVHCVRLSVDGWVYVCDRHNDRIQVFTKQGKFLRQYFVRPSTLGNGSTWTLAFSHDPAQKYLLVTDGENNVVWILRRSDGTVVSSFGHSGRNAGEFHWVHQGVIDSKGNFYTGEVDNGKRVQKFALQNR